MYPFSYSLIHSPILLTHCWQNELSHTIYWNILISIIGMSGHVIWIFLEKTELFANSGDPDQTPRSAASDLGLHCLQINLLRFSRLQWVNGNEHTFREGNSVKLMSLVDYYLRLWLLLDIFSTTQQTHNVVLTLFRRRCDVMTSQRRRNNVTMT